MKRLIIVETPYQVIVSLYLINQLNKENDSFDLLVVDSFNNSETIKNRVEELKLFDNVYYVKNKNLLYSTNSTDKIKKLYYSIFLKDYMKQININEIYDELYVWSYDLLSANLRSYLTKKNKNMKFYYYDEGYISYFPVEKVVSKKMYLKIIEFFNIFRGIKNVKRNVYDGIYLFDPNLQIEKSDNVFTIDRKLSYDETFKNNVSYIFNSKDSFLKYDKKVIIFEEAIFSNRDDVDDEKLFDKIIDLVGKENIIIKLHPRTSSDRFSNKGIKTLGNDGIPWEAVILTGDFSDKILITIGSGSIPNYKMFYGEEMCGFMLFNFVNHNIKYMNEEYNAFWDKLKFDNEINKKGFFIPKDYNEFEKKLTEILKEEK